MTFREMWEACRRAAEKTAADPSLPLPAKSLGARFMLKYEYVGGGWWRERGVAKGQKARIIHGDDAIWEAVRMAEGDPPSGW